ncbi:MAG: glycosyltransferase [Candidatus Aenigmatarchaeota archaeon]
MEKVITVREVKNPIISVVIPTLNEEKYIENTILSLKWQNFNFPYEIIISDSNSKDKTVEIAKKYVNKIVITKEKGIAKGRNIGAKYAKGKYLVFLDADTILLPNALKELYKEIRKKDVSLVSLPVLPSTFDVTFILYYMFYDVFSKTTLKLKNPQVAGMIMCCKKDDFFKVGGFEENNIVVEDYEFSKKMKKVGKVRIVDSSLALTSPRRLRKWGKFRGALKYLFLYLAYLFGSTRIANELGKRIYLPIR